MVLPAKSGPSSVVLLAVASALLAGCATPSKKGQMSDGKAYQPGDPSAPSQVTPAEALAMARQLANHPWRPFASNILHGKDPAGVLVNTPDAGFQSQPERPGWWLPGEVNVGIPYKWGGFDNPASFDAAVAAGSAAGDVSSPEKRRADNAAVSPHAAGVDCSGFVSRCLKLPAVLDTAQLPSVCTPLAAATDLRPGDLLNIPKRHVLLCAGWATDDRQWIFFYETGGAPNYWKPGLKRAPLAALIELGYQPLRYRGMARGPATDGKEVLSRAVRGSAEVIAVPSIGEP
jgi:hypothetical protein